MRIDALVIKVAMAVCAAIAPCYMAYAQNNNDPFEKIRQAMDKRFEDVRQDNERVFNNYRERINQEFSTYLEREWEKTSLSKVIPNPFKPEPKPVVDNTPAEDSKPLPHVIPLEENEEKPQPKPVEPIPPVIPDTPAPSPETNVISFSFFGNICKIHIPTPKEFALKDASIEEVSKAWDILIGDNYNNMLLECLEYRESLALCDWGMYQFLLAFTDRYCESKVSNDAVLMQMFVLCQLGYRVRLAKQGNQLYNLIAFDTPVFGAPYLEIDGVAFYNLSTSNAQGEIQICNFAFPGEESASLRMRSLPNLPEDLNSTRTVRSKSFSVASVNVRTNKNLIKFLDTYPGCSWELFAQASLSQSVKNQIYPTLKRAVAGQTEQRAANILLNFVQTGFEYKTDDEQFGREKTFFGDETFYYPYCDCEDRSVLFAILVKDLLGLDVVLLDYPSHIATAVHFNSETVGDYFDIDGVRYTICDPTYIGAPIGKSMPDMLKLKANILKVN